MTTTIEYDDELFEASFAKRFGKDALIDLSQKPSVSGDGLFIPTPAETLNIALSCGGIKKGAIVEIYGPNSTGKTTLGLEVLLQVQQLTNLPVMIEDAEQALDVDYCGNIGLITTKRMCKFSQDTELERVLNKVEHACRSGLGAVLVDSVPALTAKDQLEDDDVTDSRVGGIAKLLGEGIKRIKTASMATGTIVIFINQIRSKVGKDAMYGNPETTPGGNALPFYADLRLRLSEDAPPDYLVVDKKTGKINGSRIKVEVKKLKWGPPRRIAYYDLIFGQGIDQLGSVIEAAAERGIINLKGSWYLFHDKQLGQGRANTRAFLADKPELVKEIREAIWSKDELQ